MRTFDVSAGNIGIGRGVVGDAASAPSCGTTFNPSGTNFWMSSESLSVRASESEMVSPRRTSTS